LKETLNQFENLKAAASSDELNPYVPEFITPLIKLTQSLSFDNDDGTDGDTEDGPEINPKFSLEAADTGENWVEVRNTYYLYQFLLDVHNLKTPLTARKLFTV